MPGDVVCFPNLGKSAKVLEFFVVTLVFCSSCRERIFSINASSKDLRFTQGHSSPHDSLSN